MANAALAAKFRLATLVAIVVLCTALVVVWLIGPGLAPSTLNATVVQPLLPPSAAAAPYRLPDYRLKWLGTAAIAVSVSGDWNGWSTPGVPMTRDEDNVWAADVYLPTHCPRSNLILTGICCYRYKFYIDTGKRQRWLHDPRQPMDKDPDGWVNNFMCKYASGDDGRPLPMLRPQVAAGIGAGGKGKGKGKGGGGGGGGNEEAQPNEGPLTHAGAAKAAAEAADAAAAARATATGGASVQPPGLALPPPPPPLEVCFVLPATYLNGTALGSTSTRGLGGCCDACRRRRGCMAYNWRPEPLPRNCVFFGRQYGTPRGTALSSAGLVRVPLHASPPPSPPPTRVRSSKSSKKHQQHHHHRRKKSKSKSGTGSSSHAPD